MAEDYIIQARIVVDDRDADLSVRGVDGSMARVQGRAASLGAMITKMTGMFAMLGGAYGMGRAVKGLIGLQTEVQNAEGSIATLFSSLGGMEISDALGLARTELQGLREDAAKGVGELSDYTEAYQRLAAPLMSAGLGTDAIRAFTRQSLTAGFASRGQEGLKLAPMDIVQALTGGVNDKITPIAAQALNAIGMTQKEFNKLDTTKKIEALTRAFGTFEEGAKLMGQGWDAQMATLGDGVKELIRTATRPLFDRWSQQLRDANGWLEKNSDRLNEIAEEWGPKLVDMWDHLISQAGTYAAIVAGAAVAQAIPTGGGGGGLGGVVSMAAGGGGWSGALSGLKGLAMAAGRLALPLAIVTTAVMAMHGAVQEYPSLLTTLGERGKDAASDFGLLAESLGSLTQEGSALNIVGAALLWTFSLLGPVVGYVLRSIAFLVELISLFLTSLGILLKRFALAVRMIWALARGDVAAGKRASDELGALRKESAASLGGNMDRIRKLLYIEDTEQKLAPVPDRLLPWYKQPPEPETNPDKLQGGKAPVTNIGKVEMQVRTEVNADPARVLIALDEGLDQLRRHARQPRRVPLGATV